MVVVIVTVVEEEEEEEEMFQLQIPVKRWSHCPKGTGIILAFRIFQDEKDIRLVIIRYCYSNLSSKIDSKSCSRL